MLCFLDDGQGMSPGEHYRRHHQNHHDVSYFHLSLLITIPEEASDIITFGKSTKKSLDSHMIGKYGNGLKSLVVFTF